MPDRLPLTLERLQAEAAGFAEAESQCATVNLFGVTDGKAIGTYLEHKFLAYLGERHVFDAGNSASGIDIPSLNLDIKTTSARQPQSSCPFKSARQKIYGLGYHLMVFVYEKIDDANTKTGRLDIMHVIFVDKTRTADFQTTRGLLQIIENDGNADDITAFLQDRHLPVDEIEARDMVASSTRPERLSVSNEFNDMIEKTQRNIRQYGDFQTPPALANAACAVLARLGVNAAAVLEPTCGQGAFLAAAAAEFPQCRLLLGVEINPAYAMAAGRHPGAEVIEGDFFRMDWSRMLARDPGPWLILGNPPWITNAGLGVLGSANLPEKSNFQGHRGLDAVTGKANFDLSEWMLLQHLSWLEARSGWIAMLVKTSVARKALRQAWKRQMPTGRAAIFRIDALRAFGAAVDACFLVLPVNLGETSQNCDIYPDLDAASPTGAIGFHDEILVADVAAYYRFRDLIGSNADYVWRSGVKHDCAKVMELLGSIGQDSLTNGQGERLCLEETCLYPMLKSSDVAQGRIHPRRCMVIPQRRIGAETSLLQVTAPKTWTYLVSQAGLLDRRGSVIYKNKPRFSIFGVGDYTFAPWKVAISGFYKNTRFMKIGPVDGKPVVFDDTVYFLPCQSEEEADFILSLVQSAPYQGIIGAMRFPDEKRPVTAELLKRVSLRRVAERLGLLDEYCRFCDRDKTGQRDLELVF